MSALSLRQTAAIEPTTTVQLPDVLPAILRGGLIAGVLDALDGVVAFGLLLRMSPMQVLQYIASGLLGTAAFAAGLPAAALGAVLHFLIAFVAAAVYVVAGRGASVLAKHPFTFGAAYGAGVYLFMNYVVLPLSAVPASGFSWPLFLNGIIGHALFVGVPIAWASGTASRPAPLL